MATGYTAQRQPNPAKHTMTAQCLDGVFGTGRMKTTGTPEKWAQSQLVETYQSQQNSEHGVPHDWTIARSISASISRLTVTRSKVPSTGLRARRKTRSTGGSSKRRRRNASRAMRLIVLRNTDNRAIFLGITRPSRAEPSSRLKTCRSKAPLRNTFRAEKTAEYSSARRSRTSGRKLASPATPAQSDAQTMAALGATGTQNCTATAGTAANQESMGTLATDNGWLISTFHGGALRLKENP